MVTYSDIEAASKRIAGKIHPTPIVESSLLNKWLGHRIVFKAECLQKTGAFKFRGACNVLAHLREKNQLPQKIVANSSGNHAQAIAYAAREFDIPATIYTVSTVSRVKAAATQYYGAKLKTFATRCEADAAVNEASQKQGVLWIPPFNHPDIIAGQGTAVYEALTQVDNVDAVFTPCGGGGLLSGSLIAAKGTNNNIQVIGAEPLNANDAAQSLRTGTIVRLHEAPTTLADGAATPAVGELTFPILQQTDGFYEVPESQIAYWTQWLQHLLKIHVEPTCAMTMDAVVRWLSVNNQASKTCLVLLSGGNIDQSMMNRIWAIDYLTSTPALPQKA